MQLDNVYLLGDDEKMKTLAFYVMYKIYGSFILKIIPIDVLIPKISRVLIFYATFLIETMLISFQSFLA